MSQSTPSEAVIPWSVLTYRLPVDICKEYQRGCSLGVYAPDYAYADINEAYYWNQIRFYWSQLFAQTLTVRPARSYPSLREQAHLNRIREQQPIPSEPTSLPPPFVTDCPYNPGRTIVSFDHLPPPRFISSEEIIRRHLRTCLVCFQIDHKMGVQIFSQWAQGSGINWEVPLAELHPGDITGKPVIAIEAGYYLESFRRPIKEPLLSALGGYPLSFEFLITRFIKHLESVKVKIIFYFDGLDCNYNNIPLETSVLAAQTVSEGFDTYELGEPSGAIDKFRTVDHPSTEYLYAYLKCILHRNGVDFVTAPFRALAQMKHDLDKNLIHFAYASTEAFLYGFPKIINKIHIHYEARNVHTTDGVTRREVDFILERSNYSWLDADSIRKALGNVSPEVFHDALLLAGSSYIETFPPLLNQDNYPQQVNFRQITDLLISYLGDPRRLIESYPQDERIQQSNYLDRFMKVFVAIDNMPILHNATTVKPRSVKDPRRLGQIPRDLHSIVGLVLPPELHWYMYMGLVGPRMMNWLTKGDLKITSPLAGGQTSAYKKLVRDQLKPIRHQALALLAHSVNRWFINRAVSTSYYFDNAKDSVICKELTSEKDALSTWRVNHQSMAKRAQQLKVIEDSKGPGSLFFAVKALDDESYAASTISSAKSSDKGSLDRVREIVSNVIWRLFYLRGYVDSKHQLTSWGKLLLTALDKLGPSASRDHAEAVFLSVEMLRMEHLNADVLVDGGDPSHGNEIDKRNSVLVSRVGCSGRMRHPTKGYSGPLSRSLLAYHSLVSELRRTLRDLVEVIVAVLFLDGHATRLREDQGVIAERLPFQEDWSNGLGILAMTYLDEVTNSENPESEENQESAMVASERYLVHTDVRTSYQDALKIWVAVTEGVKASENLGLADENTRALFAQANDWLLPRSKPFM